MEVKNLHQPFALELLETDAYAAREHRKTFFELVFILEGEGIQTINTHQLHYAANKMFLIFPQDKHSFEVKAFTKFFFIRFNDSYLKTQGRAWVQKMEFIFHHHNHLPVCMLKNTTDKHLIRALVEALIREQTNDHPHNREVMAQLVNTIITVAARNLTMQVDEGPSKPFSDTSLPLLSYIHEHIYTPEQLKIEKIATRFNLSPTYISEYFKKLTGESLQQYITGYKLKLIETRLRYTDMRIREIADEFGFADESHLNRTFKKHAGVSPTVFRKKTTTGQTLVAGA